ncbi:carbamoylphosphate synthetase [Cardiosporidium cionae]|uniref:carbamoyl-phosphate synthase (ammonia) n=1 Tax=Cardiosporidium cionae TaxID=476202 RepID=A0ABQ7J9G0_9APIC|nr:carbamoylphosphate synthetase [Cardiosporidium cionae]|eukprot:KAF8820622.1 carbamoylphosphate synthetase [Cardiosporidium cionae]
MGVQFHPEASGGPTDTAFLFKTFLNSVVSPGRSTLSVSPMVFPISPTKVLILGSGGLSIGQAGEFDYSGSQAIKALKEANLFVILINSNIATVQTSSGLADKVYFLPVNTEFVSQVIAKERPDGILCTFGGQTALNCAIDLEKSGILAKYNCDVLGTPIQAIIETEDRQRFSEKLKEINECCAESCSAKTISEALLAAEKIGYPVLVRAGFALGGLGSGFAKDASSLKNICRDAFSHCDQVLVDKSLKGWKEVEYEVIRDAKDNCIAVCNMENFDPLGIHTGDSIVIAPSQTLSNKDYYALRETALKVNARLSRSSALASKATGYPLAYIAAKLSLGMDLVHIRNAVTRVTTACCEPSLDYVVTKIPRWDLRKFGNVEMQMGSAMKSVGEVMAIGRTFEESLQKALRMVENSLGFDGSHFTNVENISQELQNPSPQRIWAIAKALQMDYDIDDLHKIASLLKTKVDPSDVRRTRVALGVTPFVKQIDTLAAEFPAQTNYLYLTYQGSEHDIKSLSTLMEIKNRSNGFYAIDTQFESYVYEDTQKWQSTNPSPSSSPTNREAIPEGGQAFIVLGCGCYRIGSSVEFDWSAISCVKTLRQLGHEAVVVNCNPETVSTDYDESDRLYFEELSVETILDICDFEKPCGVIVSVGGQTPNTLARALRDAGVNILGTSVDSIDCCENRNEFSKLCDSLGIDQPEWSIFSSVKKAFEFCEKVKYPVLVRPSYVLSGDAMKVVMDCRQLESFLKGAAIVSPDYPVVITKYIEDAKEVEMDSVACDGNILNYAITEHVENAGVHSGDATLILPAHKLYVETIRRVKRLSQKLAKALMISGPFNIQFLSKQNEIKIIECNLRASRTFPFISKTYNINLVEQATRVMVNAPVRVVDIDHMGVDYVGVKVPVFSFSRLRGTDPMLGVDMRSTGEVACFGTDKYEAFLKAMISAGFTLPRKAILLSIGPLNAKVEVESAVYTLFSLGYTVYATTNTYKFLDERFSGKDFNVMKDALSNIPLKIVDKPKSAKNLNAVTIIQNGVVDLVVNISKSFHQQSTSDGFLIRRAAVDSKVSLITNVKVFTFFVDALTRKHQRESQNINFWEINAWDEYLKR